MTITCLQLQSQSVRWDQIRRAEVSSSSREWKLQRNSNRSTLACQKSQSQDHAAPISKLWKYIASTYLSFFLSNLIDLCFCCQVWDCVCSEMKVRRKDRIGLPSRGLHRTVSWNISPNCYTISNSFCIVFIFIFLFRNVRQSLTLWEAESNNLAAILNVSHGQHIEKSIESVKLNTETQR